MQLKTIIAENITQALLLAQKNYNEKAVVLCTHPLQNGNIKVVFGVPDKDDWLENDALIADNALSAGIDFFEQRLEKQHFSPVFLSRMAGAVRRRGFKVIDDKVIAVALDNLLSFQSIVPLNSNRVYVLAGNAGVGKSLCVAKLALQAKKRGLNPAVISLDIVKSMGALELEQQCKILQSPFVFLKDVSQILETVAMMRLQSDFILIDTPAINPYLPLHLDKVQFIKRQLADAMCVLVMPAGLSRHESIMQGALFAKAGCRGVIASKMDCNHGLAGLIEMCVHTNLPFVGFSSVNKISNPIMQASAPILTQLLADTGE